jgi:hypothetical protein
MAANKRTLEVDRFLTRELLLRNPDNTPPAANQAIVTDGKGGVYYTYMGGSTNTAGFNRITLPDTNQYIDADLSFNNLNFKEGTGIQIAKLNQNTLAFKSVVPLQSSFATIHTPNGTIRAPTTNSVLEINNGYGINLDVGGNTLSLSAIPAFTNLLVSTPVGLVSTVASPNASTIGFTSGSGINLGLAGTTVNIATNIAPALNQITSQNGSTLVFTTPYNRLRIIGQGNIGTALSSSTLLISSYSFNSISTPAGFINAVSTPTLVFNPGYGINWTKQNQTNTIATNLPSSFQYISTSSGTISTPYSTNTLSLESQGINLDITAPQTLKFSLASTFANQILMNNISAAANTSHVIRMSTINTGLQVSTTTNGTLLLGTTDFNQINIAGGATLRSFNPLTGANNPIFTLAGTPGTQITGDSVTNTITIRTISTLGVPIVNTAYSYVGVYSTATVFNENVLPYTHVTLNSAPGPETALNLAGVSPVIIRPNTDITKNLVYVGLDQSTLFAPINLNFIQVYSTISTVQMGMLTSTISVNTISTQSLNTADINLSSLHLRGALLISSDNTGKNYFNVDILRTSSLRASTLTASTLTTNFATCSVMNLSSFANTPTTSPLISMDYVNNRVGIYTTGPPQATLDVGGVIMAHAHATPSDPSLKEFTRPLQVTEADLEALRPWRFRWLANNTMDIGLSAAAVQQIFPEAVKIGPQGLRMVDYGRLSVVSLAALLDTNRRIAALESTVKILLNGQTQVQTQAQAQSTSMHD